MNRIAVLLSTIALLVASEVGARGTADQLPVDVELVIAVDASASMDREEFELQRAGYIEAIRHPDFIAAVERGAYGRIALSYVEWSGSRLQKIVVPWRLIDDADSASAFAAELAGREILRSRGTSISAAINFAADFIDANAFVGERRVVDVSGDGPNNYGRPVAVARNQAVDRGIVINGLPILIRPSPLTPDVGRYYSDCVIGGPGAFVLPIYAADGFALAIRRKLVLEVAGMGTPKLIRIAASATTDCLIGERQRRIHADPYLPGLAD